jgi:hypothetical protein
MWRHMHQFLLVKRSDKVTRYFIGAAPMCEVKAVGVHVFGQRPDAIASSRLMQLAGQQHDRFGNLLHRTANDLTVTGRSHTFPSVSHRTAAMTVLYYLQFQTDLSDWAISTPLIVIKCISIGISTRSKAEICLLSLSVSKYSSQNLYDIIVCSFPKGTSFWSISIITHRQSFFARNVGVIFICYVECYRLKCRVLRLVV